MVSFPFLLKKWSFSHLLPFISTVYGSGGDSREMASVRLRGLIERREKWEGICKRQVSGAEMSYIPGQSGADGSS